MADYPLLPSGPGPGLGLGIIASKLVSFWYWLNYCYPQLIAEPLAKQKKKGNKIQRHEASRPHSRQENDILKHDGQLQQFTSSPPPKEANKPRYRQRQTNNRSHTTTRVGDSFRDLIALARDQGRGGIFMHYGQYSVPEGQRGRTPEHAETERKERERERERKDPEQDKSRNCESPSCSNPPMHYFIIHHFIKIPAAERCVQLRVYERGPGSRTPRLYPKQRKGRGNP